MHSSGGGRRQFIPHAKQRRRSPRTFSPFRIHPEQRSRRFPMNRIFNLSSPLGPETLRFERLSGRESISQLFEFDLTCSSEQRGLAPLDVLGQSFTVEFEVE